MPAYKMVPMVLIGLLVLATSVFWFMPSVRPAMVDRWFKAAQGFNPAKSPEDCLDQLKRAIEKRQYDIAKDYLTGDYAELFAKGAPDARELARGIDNLLDVMKSTQTQSDKVDVMLYWLDPFPPFKYDIKNKSGNQAVALIHWAQDEPRVRTGLAAISTERYDIPPLLLHSLLPTGTTLPAPMQVNLKEENGVWKVELPAKFGDRHLRDCVEALRKHATNFRNALADIKNSIKNNPAVKQDFEREFKSNLERAK
ncbi:MAG: hypothetical protein SNJ75_06680 [Gemmataceae bacterium]